MHVKLHANATPRIRAYIQHSTASQASLARELGIHPPPQHRLYPGDAMNQRYKEPAERASRRTHDAISRASVTGNAPSASPWW
jgi:hypothetical protein